VTVTGVDDTINDGDVAYTAVIGNSNSSDPLYSGLNPADIRSSISTMTPSSVTPSSTL
jgi:hypothetical protein